MEQPIQAGELVVSKSQGFVANEGGLSLELDKLGTMFQNFAVFTGDAVGVLAELVLADTL